ncbi:MAG: hypothetical protein KDD11_23470 [Acidobacteria bacterium]|nr:hypothetical protein [Acidobacteriota bacterium]
MRSTLVRLALGVSILALSALPAKAIPPYCWDVCEFRASTYHCSYPPFGTITCGDYCTSYCPSCCTLDPYAPSSPDASATLPWDTASSCQDQAITTEPTALKTEESQPEAAD